MTSDSSTIVPKVWNYAHVLKNAGGGYGDHVEQITPLNPRPLPKIPCTPARTQYC